MAEAAVKCLYCQCPSKYSCPQCGVRYCSVKCYQHEDHLECSEIFYKDQVMKELKDMKCSAEDKRRMMEMVNRISKDKGDNDEQFDDISIRLKDVCLDDGDEVWNRLNEKEKETFKKRLESGNIDFIQIWTPWWTRENSSSGIVDLEKVKNLGLPKILKIIPDVESMLRSRKPDENLFYNIIELLLVYVFIMRLYNGDMYDSPEETVDVMLRLAKVLSENRVHCSLESCLLTFVENVETSKEFTIDPVSTCFNDLIVMLKSTDHYVLRALSDFYRYLKFHRKFRLHGEVSSVSILYKLSKKMHFLIAYCKREQERLKLLHHQVESTRIRLLNDRKLMDTQKGEIERNLPKLRTKCSPLIEEL